MRDLSVPTALEFILWWRIYDRRWRDI